MFCINLLCDKYIFHSLLFLSTSGPTKQDPDYETFNANIDLEEDISATGSYTLTKVNCRTHWSTSDRLVSRVYRSANSPEDDINGMMKDSILAKVDQGVGCLLHN